MNKKFVLPITFAIILASAVFVLADNFNIKYNVAVDEGWNLLQGFVTPDLITGGEITSQDVVAVYAYLPSENKYARIYPNPEVKVDDEELLNSAFWVYLKKSGWLEYNVEEEWAYANNRNMVAGWNFVGITPDILGKSLNEIMGDCNIEKAYFWNFEDKEWNSLTEGRLKDNKFNNDVIGLGVVVKVSNDCTLKVKVNGGSSINPPTIPEENSCASFNYEEVQCIANGCICEGPDCRVCWPRTSETLCTDSDNGLNYNVKGETGSGANPSYTDYCPTNDVPNTLVEYTCAGEDVTGVVSNYYVCPNGCSDGACIQ